MAQKVEIPQRESTIPDEPGRANPFTNAQTQFDIAADVLGLQVVDTGAQRLVAGDPIGGRQRLATELGRRQRRD